MKIWNCCRALFSLGPLERRDAYNVLSLYLYFFPCTEECEVAEEFDIRAEKEFWDEIKRGLVLELYFLRLLDHTDFQLNIKLLNHSNSYFIHLVPFFWWGLSG